MISVLSFIGTRPEAIKMAPVVRALKGESGRITSTVCVTGQHRDLLAPLLDHFRIRADENLDLMTADQTLPALTGRIINAVEPLLRRQAPDWVLVQGDTTTVMAVGLVAFQLGVRVAHVEAGLRTGDRHQPFPEEVNRRVTSLVADLHFAPTTVARDNLIAEGVSAAQVIVTGNTAIDTLLTEGVADLRDGDPLAALDGRRVVLVTAHRRENHGAGLRGICAALTRLAARYGDALRIVCPVHPNPTVQRTMHDALGNTPNIVLTPPIEYPRFVSLLHRATLVLTDSGGLQEECPSLGKPVLVLRDTTERPEVVHAGAARLVGTDPDRIVDETMRLLDDDIAYAAMARRRHLFGDGHAAERIVEGLLRYSAAPGAAPHGSAELLRTSLS